jgi:hypothetical protein
VTFLEVYLFNGENELRGKGQVLGLDKIRESRRGVLLRKRPSPAEAGFHYCSRWAARLKAVPFPVRIRVKVKVRIRVKGDGTEPALELAEGSVRPTPANYALRGGHRILFKSDRSLR